MLVISLILLVVTIVMLFLGAYRSSSRFAVEQRIEQIRASGDQTAEEELSKPFVQRVLLPIGESVARVFRGYTPAEISDRTHRKLVMAGLYPRVTSAQLLGLCWLSLAGGLLLILLLLVSFAQRAGSDVRWDDPWNIAFLVSGAFGGY